MDTAISIHPGMQLPERNFRPGEVQLFRFSAVSWNAHRIHYDRDYAAREGYPAPLVHSQLLGSFLCSVVTAWLGPLRGRIVRIEWRNLAPAFAGEPLVALASVRALREDAGVLRVELDISSRDARDAVVAQGTATAVIPSSSTMNKGKQPHERT